MLFACRAIIIIVRLVNGRGRIFYPVSVAEVAASTKFPRPLQMIFLSEPLNKNPLLVGSGTLCVVRRGSWGASSPAKDSIDTTDVLPLSERITAGREQWANTPERDSTSPCLFWERNGPCGSRCCRKVHQEHQNLQAGI